MELVSVPRAAKLIGVTPRQVREWARRSKDPLPSILIGGSGRFRKIIVDAIAPWLAREAEVQAALAGRTNTARR